MVTALIAGVIEGASFSAMLNLLVMCMQKANYTLIVWSAERKEAERWAETWFLSFGAFYDSLCFQNTLSVESTQAEEKEQHHWCSWEEGCQYILQ